MEVPQDHVRVVVVLVVDVGWLERCEGLRSSGALSPITPTRATQLFLFSLQIIGFRKDFI